MAAYFLMLAFIITLDGPWDHESVSKSRIMAGTCLFFASLLVRAFNRAQWLRTWWYALPVALAAGALWRLMFPGKS